jgi:predicted transcriptional regulator of viral defense system
MSRGQTMEKGVPIRAISRGLSVLQSVNKHGGLTMMEIAQLAEVPYPTACRIVQTLLYEGMLEREPGRKRYRATPSVLTLSSSYHGGHLGQTRPLGPSGQSGQQTSVVGEIRAAGV